MRNFYNSRKRDKGDQILDSIQYSAPPTSSQPSTVMIISVDRSDRHNDLIHVSLSHPDRDPTWETLKALKQVVFGDTDAMIVLPSAEYYVNVHRHCFHIWQMPEKWEIG